MLNNSNGDNMKKTRRLLDALLVYEKQQNDKLSIDEALKDLGIDKNKKQEILKIVYLIPELLENYDFKR